MKYLLLISWLRISSQKFIRQKIPFPTNLSLLKTKREKGDFLGPKIANNGKIYFEPCFQLLKKTGTNQKPQQVYLSEKKGEKISAIRNIFIHDAENVGLVPVLEPYCDKDSTMEQELANCHAVYDIAAYQKRKVCFTIKKYSVNKPPYIHIRLFAAKENEVLKQVTYVNYALNDSKELAQVLRGSMYVEKSHVQ